MCHLSLENITTYVPFVSAKVEESYIDTEAEGLFISRGTEIRSAAVKTEYRGRKCGVQT